MALKEGTTDTKGTSARDGLGDSNAILLESWRIRTIS
jgi:hypothetical protein